MAFRSDMEAGIVVCRLDPIDLCGFQEQNLSGAFDGQPLRLCWPIFVYNPLLGSGEGARKTRVIERFQKIVKSPRLEGTQRILVESCHENDRPRQIIAEHFKHIETVQLRHLHIQKHDVWVPIADVFKSLLPRAALADDFDFWIAAQQDAKIAAREG